MFKKIFFFNSNFQKQLNFRSIRHNVQYVIALTPILILFKTYNEFITVSSSN